MEILLKISSDELTLYHNKDNCDWWSPTYGSNSWSLPTYKHFLWKSTQMINVYLLESSRRTQSFLILYLNRIYKPLKNDQSMQIDEKFGIWKSCFVTLSMSSFIILLLHKFEIIDWVCLTPKWKWFPYPASVSDS